MPDPNTQTQPLSKVSAESSADPLASLHRMSTTAGVASRDYVAVNAAAVIAALLGAGSALALFAGILLVIPIAGVIVSVIAWRQISNSSGTEAGRGLVIGGFVLSLLFAGGVISVHVLEATRASDDARKISAVVKSLGEVVAADHLDEAYNFFDKTFKDRVPSRTFEEYWRAVNRGDSSSGKLKGLKWNEVAPGYENTSSATNVYMDVIVVFERSSEQRLRFIFRQSGDRWYIHDIPGLFPPAKGTGAR